ncbi:MAG: putative bifunctional diguanylate cyclase/phosphodiesterase, partial [Solirubrobacteraceae bacterium]
MSRVTEHYTVLAVQADEAAHAPVRAALKAIEGTGYEVHWVTSARAALAALEEHPHDAFLIDCDLRDPEHSGLDLARDILAHAPHAPVLLLDDVADRDTDLTAAEAGVADYLVHPSPATLERSLRYAITHQRALGRLAESEERHALALQGANDGLWDWDVRADRLYFSPRWKAMLGYPEAQIGDAPGEWLGRVHPDDRAGLTQALEGHLSGATQHFESEHRIQHRDGGYRWMLSRGIAVRDHTGRATRVVGSQTDVTDRRQAEQRLQHDALHDALTGLPNRVLFLDRLAQAIRRAQRRHPETCAAVLFADLDRFKLVNDSLGHHVGDRLLIAVARRLESALRPGDTVARLGGDEFTILLDDVGDAREAAVIAERVQQTLQEPFHLDGRELVVAASIGIALADPDAEPADVMRDADVAMYRAKAEGKGRHAVFDARMHERVMRRLDLETDLRRAIEAGELKVFYQPIVQAATGRIVGFEALSRWPGPDGAHIEPADFVPIAEETGLIVALGRMVLETASRRLAEWRQLPGGAGLTLSVNVSHRQLSEPNFAVELDATLAATGLDPRALRLEIREHDLARGAGGDEGTRRTLAHVLQTLGVRWQIDDFGTGASSLRLLHRFPGDAVKIFGPLVSGMGHDGGSFEIVKAIVELAHNLGLEVIAEGVETAGQLEHLRVLGCEFAQGFHISAPLAAEDARALLA